MAINAVNSGNGVGSGSAASYDISQQAALLSPAPATSASADPAEIAKICTPPSVTLDADTVKQLEAYKTYDAVTRASLSALAQTLAMNDKLIQMIGGQSPNAATPAGM